MNHSDDLVRQVVELPFADSTNLRLKEGDHPPGTLLYTLNQRAGRGRLGRQWSAPPGKCLALSVLLPPTWLSDTTRPLLPLCAALAVRNALAALCDREDFTIKWPNDILCSGRKICGILCEHSFFDTAECTVCGMGINLTQTAEEFAEQDLPHAGSLAMLCPLPPQAKAVVTAVAHALDEVLRRLRDGQADVLLRAYTRHCATLGQPVRVVCGCETFTGTAEGLTDDGSLTVRTDSGLRTVCAGEVSVRGLYGYLP